MNNKIERLENGDFKVLPIESPKHYKDFEDWFFEGEEYAMRCERFYESLTAFKSELGLEANMLVWLKAAFEAGRGDNNE